MRHVFPLVFVVALLYSSSALAILGIGDIVLDPTNLVQNTLTAARTLQSNTNEALQIKNQLDQLMQQAKHLVAMPASIAEQVSSLTQQYNDLLNQGKYISYSVKSSIAQFDALYETAKGEGSLPQKAQRMIGQIRDVSRSLTAISAIYERLCAQQANVQTLLATSMASPGTLAATQANSQLLGVLADQGSSLQAIYAASARLQAHMYMREVTYEDAARASAEQWLHAYGQGTFKGPGEGQGRRLPE